MNGVSKRLRHISLFSGIGGFDYAASLSGWENVANCEIDANCRKILKKHFPKSIQHENITETDFTRYISSIDVVSGGVPCQPFSLAGKQRGKEDERYLWHEFTRAIREIQPKWFVAENVSGLLSNSDGHTHRRIIEDLEAEGYETINLLLPATAAGAPHERKRVWIVGYNEVAEYTNTTGGELGEIQHKSQKERAQDCIKLLGNPFGFHWHEAISAIHRENNGIPGRMDGFRNRALGNAIVPQIAYMIFQSINNAQIYID